MRAIAQSARAMCLVAMVIALCYGAVTDPEHWRQLFGEAMFALAVGHMVRGKGDAVGGAK